MLVSPAATTATLSTAQANKSAGDKDVAPAISASADLLLMKDADAQWFPVQQKHKKTTAVRKIVGLHNPDNLQCQGGET